MWPLVAARGFPGNCLGPLRTPPNCEYRLKQAMYKGESGEVCNDPSLALRGRSYSCLRPSLFFQISPKGLRIPGLVNQ